MKTFVTKTLKISKEAVVTPLWQNRGAFLLMKEKSLCQKIIFEESNLKHWQSHFAKSLVVQ